MKPRKALVTGATGHIGSALCRALREDGTEVVAFVRPSSSRRALEGLDVDVAVGDVLDAGALAAAAATCDVVFHAAALFEVSARDEAAVHRVAVEGSRNAIAAAAAAGARVVLVSSVTAAGFGQGPADLLDEEAWATDPAVPYYRAKLDGEREAERLATELGVDLVRVLPTLVLGPGDFRVTPSSRVLVDMLRGDGVTFDGGANVIDVRDLVRAMIVAAERGRPGARYILGGENLSIRELGAIMSRYSGKPARHVALPRWAMTALAGAMELGAAMSGNSPPLTRAIVHDVYGRYAWYDVARARNELGLTTRPVADTIRDAAQFFEAQGIVPARTLAEVA